MIIKLFLDERPFLDLRLNKIVVVVILHYTSVHF